MHPTYAPSSHENRILHTVPTDDLLFARAVRSEVDRVGPDIETLRLARQRLHTRYPKADLHHQRSVLVNGSKKDVWFAYREGRSGPVMPGDRWWEKPGAARCLLQSSGRLTALNAAGRSLLNAVQGDGSIRLAKDYFSAGLLRELAEKAGVRARSGALTTTTAVSGPDQASTDADLHVEWQGSGPMRIAMRSVAARDEALLELAVRDSSLGTTSTRVRKDVLETGVRRDQAPGMRLQESVVGDPWAVLVVAGIIRLYLATDGREPTLFYAGPGTLLGTHLALADESLAIGAQSVTSCVLEKLSASRVASLLDGNAKFAQAVSREALALLHAVTRLYAARSSLNLSQRLAREICILQDLLPRQLVLPITEQQLAEGVGSIRESVGRSIAEFRRSGWIATTNHGPILLDRPALRRHGRFDSV
ncbi:MAG: family transcriptional regulator, cyclic receptor protein [Solirubrobacteraceae bacterium]|nr:family transcriptional regulator, cyclic receptor protein [Solirubrobacteraceae bacterium]